MTDAAKHWGDAEHTAQLARVSWMASPAVQLHLNERATGSPAVDWLTGWARAFFPARNLNVLVLGCGEGWLERAIATDPKIAHIDALDFAADAVERARAAAKDLPKIDYAVTDLNQQTLAADRYDVVIAHSVLHHIQNLEHAFDQIERAMKRDAALIVNEYVGPSRFQYGDDVLRIINRLLVCLPERLRRGVIEPRVYDAKTRPTIEEMTAADPSEAVRSADLLPLIRSRFSVVDERPIGGTILQFLLYDIVQNFDFAKPKERAMLEILCAIEAALIDAGTIPCDFVNVAARRKDGVVTHHVKPVFPKLARDLFDRDPLGLGPAPSAPPATEASRLPDYVLRMLRSALLAARTSRRPLVARSAGKEWLEELRYRRAGTSPMKWAIARFRGAAKTSEEDAPLFCLLEAADEMLGGGLVG